MPVHQWTFWACFNFPIVQRHTQNSHCSPKSFPLSPVQPRSVLEVSLGEQSVPHQDLVIAEKPCAAEVEDELEGTADPAEGEEFTEDLLYDSAGSMSEDILDLNVWTCRPPPPQSG